VDISRSLTLVEFGRILGLVEFSGILRLVELGGLFRYRVDVNGNFKLVGFSGFFRF